MAQGEGERLDEAFHRAWEDVPARDKPKWHRVEIFVIGTDERIGEYRVVLTAEEDSD